MRKLVCFAMAIFLSLSLFSCAKINLSNTASQAASATESQTELNHGTSSMDKTSSKTTSASNHKHKYEKAHKIASCGQAGGDEYTCACGDSYMENRVSPSYKHTFVEENLSLGEGSKTIFRCTQCNIEALYVTEWWELKTKLDELRFYVTGKIVPDQDGKSYSESDYEIVICGNGEIEDYDTTTAPWHQFLASKLKGITVANGITSIGKNAFYYRTSRKQEVSFNIGGSVKTIKSGAIKLSVTNIVLGQGTEVIESGAITGAENIYLPKTVKACPDLGRRGGVCYYYGGDLESLLTIEVENPNIAGSPPCTLKERCEWSVLNNETPSYACAVILNSQKIAKGTAIFNGTDVKTDAESLKLYIN